jgi:hypothetical protein
VSKLNSAAHEVPHLPALAQSGRLPLAMAIPAHIEKLECFACHATWACNRIPGRFRRDDRQVSPQDFVTGEAAATAGHWTVKDHGTLLAPPLLAQNARGKVSPATVRLVPVVDHVGEAGERLLASRPQRSVGNAPAGFLSPFQPHTLARRGRPCESCHVDVWTFLDDIPPRAGALGWPAVLREARFVCQRGCRTMDGDSLARVRFAATCVPCHRADKPTPAWQTLRDAARFAASDEKHQRLYRDLGVRRVK